MSRSETRRRGLAATIASASTILIVALIGIATIAGCHNPLVGPVTDTPPPKVRIADPVNSITPVWRVEVASGAVTLEYRLISTPTAAHSGEAMPETMVDWTKVDVTDIPTVSDLEEWDRTTSQWVAPDTESEDPVGAGTRELYFAYSQPLEEAIYAYTLSVKAGYGTGTTSERGFRQTVVDVTDPAAPAIDDPIIVSEESATITWSGPDDRLGHYVMRWDYGDEQVVACNTDAAVPTGAFSTPGTLGHGETHTLTVRAVDTAGNRSQAVESTISVNLYESIPVFPATENVTQTADRVPTWHWRAPAGSSKVRYQLVTGSDTVLVNWTEIDVSTVDPTGTIQPPPETEGGSPAPLSEGVYTVVMQAWFPVDVVWSEENSHSITITLCNLEAPTVSGDDRTNQLLPTFSWPDPSEATGYRYQLNGEADGGWTTIDEADLESFTRTVDSAEVTYVRYTLATEVPRGSHTIYVQVADSDGVWSASGSFTFTVETERPGLLSFTLRDPDRPAEDNVLSHADLEYTPPDAYLQVSFSEAIDLTATAHLVRCTPGQPTPEVTLAAPVAVSADTADEFTVTPSGGTWPEGGSFVCSVDPAVADEAGNELDPSTYAQISFDVAITLVTATDASAMPDDELRAVIPDFASASDEYTYQVTSVDLSPSIYDGLREGITDLTGLGAFDELRLLDLGGCTGIGNDDTAALAGMELLASVDLENTGITDLSFLEGAEQLWALTAAKRSEVLGTGYESISSIASLSGLSGLRMIDLRGNDLGTTADRQTDLIDPLTAQADLERLLLCGNTGLGDVSFLTSALPELTGLWLENCGITTIDLSNQTALEELTLAGNSGLASVTGIGDTVTTIDLAGTAVTGLDFASGLTELTELTVSDTTLTDVSSLTGNTGITSLTLESCGLDDTALTVIGGLTQLTYLDLSGNTFTDVTPLLDLTALESLDLSANGLTGLPSGFNWASLNSLSRLDLSANRLGDVTPLASLPSVGTLILADNTVSGSTTITNGIDDLDALYTIDDAEPYPPWHLVYLVFSGNTGLESNWQYEYLTDPDRVPSWTTIYAPSDENPFGETP